MMLQRKKDIIGEINILLNKNFSGEVSNKMFLVIFQKYISMNYGDSKRLLDSELKFLRNLQKCKCKPQSNKSKKKQTFKV